ncbi:MAG TPA: hypothetical protein VG308_15165 [Stellaceae bacterium]|nr:hypothetical protein [Stellaceae bacterium]
MADAAGYGHGVVGHRLGSCFPDICREFTEAVSPRANNKARDCGFFSVDRFPHSTAKVGIAAISSSSALPSQSRSAISVRVRPGAARTSSRNSSPWCIEGKAPAGCIGAKTDFRGFHRRRAHRDKADGGNHLRVAEPAMGKAKLLRAPRGLQASFDVAMPMPKSMIVLRSPRG